MRIAQWMAAVRGEWYKLTSLRSTWLTLAAAVVIAVGVAYGYGLLLADFVSVDGMPDLDRFYPGSLALVTALPALAAFGVISTAGEFSARTLSASLLSVPVRGGFYLAKVVAAGVLSSATVLVMVPLSFMAAQAGLGESGVGFDADGTGTVLVGSVVFLTLMALFAIGVGAVARNSAAALGVLLPFLFLSSQGFGNIPAIQEYAQYLPDQGGQVIMRIVPEGDPVFGKDYGPWQGLGIVAAWASAVIVAGWWATRRSEP